MSDVVEKVPEMPVIETEPTVPMLLREAITAGNTELARELMGLMRDLKAEAAKEAFHAAWAKVWPKLPRILKTKEVTFKSGKKYYYADMAGLIDQVYPILAEEGMSLAHEVSNDLKENTVTVVTILGHKMGYERRNQVTLPIDLEGTMGPQQRFGSAMTYAQRYSSMTALGLAATEDTDAADLVNGADRSLTEEEAAQLEGLIRATKADRAALYRQAGERQLSQVKSVKDIGKKYFDFCIPILQARKEQANGK